MADQGQIERRFLHGRVRVVVGDITSQMVDVIVNAANSSLLGGGGVDGAIHEMGGPRVLEECRELRRTSYPQGLPTGETVITTAGELPARHVIHTVGPIRGVDPTREAEQLAACYRNSLALAVENGAESIAFPAISTGIYGYPREEAAAIASTTIAAFLAGDDSIREVRMVFYSQKDCDVFLRHHQFERDL